MASAQHQQATTREGQTCPENDQPTGSETETKNQQISPLSQRGVTGGTYERNPLNNLFLGPSFEANVAIYSMLTLKNDKQALAFECQTAPAKFDDVVLRVQNGNSYDYYCNQLKHRDKYHDPDACLTWNDLLTGKKPAKFGIPWYYECLSQPRLNALKDVKGLAFVTNYNLVKQGSAGTVNNLENLAKTLLNQVVTNKSPKIYITDDDLKLYFQECNTENDKTLWTPPMASQQSYKFTDTAVKAIFKGTKAGFKGQTAFDVSAYDKFLQLLVFRVSMPRVNELEEINQQHLKLFLPFYKSLLIDHYEKVKAKFKELFEPLPDAGAVNTSGQSVLNNAAPAAATAQQCIAAWATIERRQSVFEKLTQSFKEKVSIGSNENYEIGVLTPIYRQLYPDRCCIFGDTPPWNCIFKEMSAMLTKSERNPFPVVNIYNDDSNAMVLTLNIFSHLTSFIKEHSWRTIFVQVKEKAGITSVVGYFKKLKEEVSHHSALIGMSFCCVIEVSPFYYPADKAVEQAEKLTKQLIELLEVRKWIQFVVVTQAAVLVEEVCDGLQTIQGTQLSWDNLSEEGKTYLLHKTLYLETNKQTTLNKLGFKKETIKKWLHSNSLAELIIHDEERPLSLGLPLKHLDLEGGYIDREIQLPFVRNAIIKELKKHFTCGEEHFNGASYLLMAGIDSKQRRNIYLAPKSKAKSNVILEIEPYITKSNSSGVTVDETDLFKDNVNFGTGSKDNKLIVVVDYPGKGKTWLLNSLSNRFLESWNDRSPHYLLLRVNLRDVSDWKDYSGPLEFLVRHSLDSGRDSAGRANHLNCAIVKEKCLNAPEGASVYVLLDGYDEISDEQRSITLDVARYLKNEAKGVKRIILTSRPEGKLEKELEAHFAQFSLHLRNFSKETQIDYLTKRWTAKLTRREKLNGANQKVEFFARELVNFASCHLKDEYSSTFLDIPLQCWIFSECFSRELEQYLELASTDGETKPTFDEASFELLNLYNRFYDVKVDVLLQEKAGLPDKNELFCYVKKELSKTFLDTMMRLSTIHLMKDADDAQAISCLDWDVYRGKMKMYDDESQYSNDLMRALKLGFVKGSGDGKQLMRLARNDVKFLHRTFAEYFFATALMHRFTRTKTELLDDVSVPGQRTPGNGIKLIGEQILVAEEYAGVRRFFDRMLAKYLPPAGEPCPFATADRTEVFEHWPAVGHGMFNKHFAESAMSQVSDLFKQWQESKQDGNDCTASERLEQDISTLIKKEAKPEAGLAGILYGHGDIVPSITLLLLHCIKEYACRPDTSPTDRETLAYFLTITAIMSIRSNRSRDEKGTRLMTSVLHSLDRVPGLSAELNNVFTTWFTTLVSALIGDLNHEDEQGMIVSTCEMLKYHSDPTNAEEIVQSILSSAGIFLQVRIDSVPLSNAFPSKSFLALFQRIFSSLKSLNFAIKAREQNPLFAQLADCFTSILSQRTRCMSTEPELARHLLELTPAVFYERFQSIVSQVGKVLAHPIVLNEIVELLENNASQLPKRATIERLFGVTLNYIHEAQRLLYAVCIQADAGLLALKRNSRGLMVASNWCKIPLVTAMFWYSLLTDKITPYLDSDEKIRKQNAFLTRKLLMAYADGCCCNSRQLLSSYLGIYYPRNLYLEKNTTFSCWFTNKLEQVWDEANGEIGFIDFLFKRDEPALDNADAQGFWMQIRERIAECEKDPCLTAVGLARLPCLLFSDAVCTYIPGRLSPEGLKHLRRTLQELPLYKCDKSCFRSTACRTQSASTNSVWHALMREDATEMFSCKSRTEQIRALQEIMKRIV